MKKILFLGLAGALALSSCSSEDLLGEQAALGQKDNSEISFGPKTPGLTRAESGSTAAQKLGNTFNVYGVETKGADATPVFPDYVVKYDNDRWVYYGVPGTTGQLIKYWDKSADRYDFFAWAYGGNTKNTADVTHTNAALDTDPVFTVKANNPKDLANVYVAGKETRFDNDNTKPMTGQVALTFKSMGAKVRMAFFEIIPGYRVYITGVYVNNSATTASTAKTELFVISDANVGFPTGQTSYTVDYDNYATGSALKIKSTASYSKTLSFGNSEIYVASTNGNYDPTKAIGTSVTTATSTEGDGKISSETGGAYTCVYPMPENTCDLNLKIAYTMEAEDNGAKQKRTATVVIPYEYAQWKPNYAYSYLFKLTDSTLDPITFDAIVLNETDGTQETVTKIDNDDNYSITTTQPGLVSDALYDFFISGHQFNIRVENKRNEAQTLTTDNLNVYYVADATSIIESNAASYCVDGNKVTGEEAVTYNEKVATFTPHNKGSYIVRFSHTSSGVAKYSYKVLNVAMYTVANIGDLVKGTTSVSALQLQMDYNGTPVTLPNATFTSTNTTVATINSDKKVEAHEVGTTTIEARLGNNVIATKTINVTAQ